MDSSIIPYLILLIFVLVFYISTCKNALTESFGGGKQKCSDLSFVSDCSDAGSSSCEDHWSWAPKNSGAMRCNYSGKKGCGYKTNKKGLVNKNWMCKNTPDSASSSTESPAPTPAPARRGCKDANAIRNNNWVGNISSAIHDQNMCSYEKKCKDSDAKNGNPSWKGQHDPKLCSYEKKCKDSDAENGNPSWKGQHDPNLCKYERRCKDSDAKNGEPSWKGEHDQEDCRYERRCKDSDAENGDPSWKGRHDESDCEYKKKCKDRNAINGEPSWKGKGDSKLCIFEKKCTDRDAIRDGNWENSWVTKFVDNRSVHQGGKCRFPKKCKDSNAIESIPSWKGEHDPNLCVYAGCVNPKFGKNFIKSGVKLDVSSSGKRYQHDESKCKTKYKERCFDNNALSNRNAPNDYPNKTAKACGIDDYESRCKDPSAVNDSKRGYFNNKNWPGKSDPSKCKYKGCKDPDALNSRANDNKYIEGGKCNYAPKCKDSNSLEFESEWANSKYPKNNNLCKYDKTGPVFELNFGNKHPILGTEFVGLGERWKDPKWRTKGKGALYDENDPNPTVSVQNANFSTNKVGKQVVKYIGKDKYGNTTTKQRVVEVLDLVAPQIKLKPHSSGGVADVELTIGDKWVDPGVEVTDNVDKNLKYLATVSGDHPYIRTDVPGKYTITYSATDNARPTKNPAKSVTRTVVVKDSAGPDIILAGDNPHYISAKKSGYYKNIDPGIEKVLDDVDKVSNDKVAIVRSSQINSQGKAIKTGKNAINLSKPGDYEIIYQAKDSAGNIGTARRLVRVLDNTPPTIKLKNDSVIELAIGDKYVEYGATVKDNIDSNLKYQIEGVENIRTDKPGVYSVRYSAQDNAKNSTNPDAIRQVVVKDKAGPSIQLNGPGSMEVPQGSRYIEEGAKANDDIDGPVVPIIDVTPQGNVNTSKRGVYTVTYHAKDRSGNSSGKIERIVHVVDKTPPHITFKNPPGWKEEKPYPGVNGLDWGSTYTEYYAALRDDDGKVYDLDDKVKTRIKSPKGNWVSKLDTKIEGVWTVLYNGKDADGNQSKTIRRKVLILPEPDKIPPQLALNNPIYPGESGIEVGVAGRDDNKYIEYGARALDDDGTVLDKRVKIKVNGIEDGVVDTNTVGQYNVEYNVTDLAGNPAQTITRVVYVVDTTKPIITLNGENPMLIDHSSKYEELGAKAFDNGVDISERIKIDGRVNVKDEREYIIRYSVTDDNGLTTTKSRIVHVIDRFRVLCKEPVYRTLKCEELEREICEGNRVSAQYNGEPYHCIFKDELCQKGLKCGTRPKQGDEIWLQRLSHKFNNEKI